MTDEQRKKRAATERERRRQRTPEQKAAASAYARAYQERNRDRLREQRQAWSADHRDALRDNARRYRETHRDEIRARERARYETNAERIAESSKARYNPTARRSLNLAARYNMTDAEFEQRLATQGGCCPVCRRAFGGRVKPHVDHDHSTSAVRGILCQRCNPGIGALGDTAATVQAAWRYLHNHEHGYEAGLGTGLL